MSDYKTTITAVAVHKDGDNPIFGESVTVAEIDDDGGGPFIVLKQQRDESRRGEVRLTLEECQIISRLAEKMLDKWPE